MAAAKPHMNFIFVGHVDHGKSTSVGRLLYDSGNVSEQAMKKLEEKAKQLGKVGFEFAFVMDNLKEEQERGVTIDLSHQKFVTDKYDFTIIDAPGHRDFVKNMITGAAQADAGFLVVAATDGVNAQTKEHVFLCKTLGVKQLHVLINKMDLAKYEEKRFKEVVDEVTKLMKMVGYDVTKVKFVPVASLKGENLVKRSENMNWYTGPTALEVMNALDPVDHSKLAALALRLPIQDVYNITGVGVVPVGRVETGVLKVNDKIFIVPARDGKGIAGEVKAIEMHHESLPSANPGDNIGFNVRGITVKDVARGDVAGLMDSIPTVVEDFVAQIIVLNHPSVITVGYTPVFHIHTAQVACQFVELIKKLSPEVVDKPDFIKNGESALVKIKPTKNLVVEKATEFQPLGRFAIRDSGVTVAAGVCVELTKKKA